MGKSKPDEIMEEVWSIIWEWSNKRITPEQAIAQLQDLVKRDMLCPSCNEIIHY